MPSPDCPRTDKIDADVAAPFGVLSQIRLICPSSINCQHSPASLQKASERLLPEPKKPPAPRDRRVPRPRLEPLCWARHPTRPHCLMKSAQPSPLEFIPRIWGFAVSFPLALPHAAVDLQGPAGVTGRRAALWRSASNQLTGPTWVFLSALGPQALLKETAVSVPPLTGTKSAQAGGIWFAWGAGASQPRSNPGHRRRRDPVAKGPAKYRDAGLTKSFIAVPSPPPLHHSQPPSYVPPSGPLRGDLRDTRPSRVGDGPRRKIARPRRSPTERPDGSAYRITRRPPNRNPLATL